MKKLLITLSLIVIFFIAIIFYYQHHQNKKPPITVTVTQGNIIQKAEAVGYIKPRHSSTVKAQLDGTVAEIYHFEGERVKKGAPLLKIKPAPSPDEYALAHQILDDAKEREKTAKEDLNRYKKALKQGLISASYTDYIISKKNHETTKLARILATQKLALLEKGKTIVAGKVIANIVTSPIDGYILTRIVDVGDSVISISAAQASTPLFTMANMNDLMFEGTVDEMDAAQIHNGMPATITIGALPDKKIFGTLSRISLQSERENIKQGAIKEDTDSPFNVGFKIEITKLQFPKELILRSGYSATANINIKTVKNILILPVRTVHFKDGKPYVLLPPKEKNKEPIKQSIKTGISDGMNIQIVSGIQLGDKIVDEKHETKI